MAAEPELEPTVWAGIGAGSNTIFPTLEGKNRGGRHKTLLSAGIPYNKWHEQYFYDNRERSINGI